MKDWWGFSVIIQEIYDTLTVLTLKNNKRLQTEKEVQIQRKTVIQTLNSSQSIKVVKGHDLLSSWPLSWMNLQ